jgi:glucose/arabinose dehydrogenase
MITTNFEPLILLVRRRGTSALSSAALAVCAASTAWALEIKELATPGLNEPVFVTAPAGDHRLFVVEKGGQIKVMQGGVLLTTPFLNLNVGTLGERGLLGLAFDPNFADSTKTGYRTFYVDYIHPTTGSTVVASYRVSAANPNVADLSTAKTVLTVTQPAGRANHKAGWIGFRKNEPDNLYIATGDGGARNDPDNRAQNVNDNLGKILRVNVRADDFPSDPDRNYAVPADNPFGKVGSVDIPGNDEIWAYGLRNPFRNSFDRRTGDFYIADVGQDAIEEIDFVAAGAAGGKNFGWRGLEGRTGTGLPTDPPPTAPTPPILDYERKFGRTVIGGYVVHGLEWGVLDGAYVFGDFASGRIWAIRYKGSFIDMAQATEITDILNPGGDTIRGLSSFGEDGLGRLYLVDVSGGAIFAVVPEPGKWALLLVSLVPVISIARRRVARAHQPRGAG